MTIAPTLDQKIRILLLRLATSQRDAGGIAHALEIESDPADTIARILYNGRKHLNPAMMPGYRRAGKTARRMR